MYKDNLQKFILIIYNTEYNYLTINIEIILQLLIFSEYFFIHHY